MASVAEVATACAEEGRELWVTHCPATGGTRTTDLHLTREAGHALEHVGELLCTPLEAGHVPDPLPRMAIVLGTEGEGISSEMLANAARAVFLPMHGFVQSLNVAVACGMVLQRLFDLCPAARGDLSSSDRVALRQRAT